MKRIVLITLFPLRYYAYLTSPQAGLPATLSMAQPDGRVTEPRLEPSVAQLDGRVTEPKLDPSVAA